ncbi:AAA family ATPase [Paenibacillus curdlanolyticus]|nr:AAA family ATPase [Paenibacillus curdlanolyticus]
MSDTEKWFDQMAEHILINGIKEVAQSYVRPAIRIDEWGCLFEAYEPYQEGVDSVLAYSSRFLNRAMKKLLDAGSIYFDRLKPYAEFIDWIISHKDAFDIEVDLIDSSVAFIKMHALEASHSQSKLFQTFFEHYIRTCRPYYYLNFSWELSTGESNLLSLFARMHAVLKPEVDGGRGTKLVNDFINGEVMCEQVLLLIDEADLSYHPRWQLKYVSALLDAVSSLYSYYKVQILLTTHSPLLLSDIPKSQVLYLRQGKVHLNTEHQETFGQNIYTLFNDAFFVDKTAGEFSDRMIRSVHSGLEELLVQMKSKEDGAQSVEGGMNERLDYLAYIISIIGEPVIRKAFDAKLQQIRAAYQSSKLKETIALYNDLSVEERNQLIDHIIKTNDGRQ